MSGLIYTIIVGLVAGFLAGNFMKGKGFGVLGNIVIGILGAVIGSWAFGMVIAGLGLIGDILRAFAGAVILIFVVGLFKKM